MKLSSNLPYKSIQRSGKTLTRSAPDTRELEFRVARHRCTVFYSTGNTITHPEMLCYTSNVLSKCIRQLKSAVLHKFHSEHLFREPIAVLQSTALRIFEMDAAAKLKR